MLATLAPLLKAGLEMRCLMGTYQILEGIHGDWLFL